MLLERAELLIREGQEEGFSRRDEGTGIGTLSAVPGIMSVSLGRGVENPGKFMLLVEWQNMDAHSRVQQDSRVRRGPGIDRPFLQGGQHGAFPDGLSYLWPGLMLIRSTNSRVP